MGVSFSNNMIVHESLNLETYSHLYYASHLFILLVLFLCWLSSRAAEKAKPKELESKVPPKKD